MAIYTLKNQFRGINPHLNSEMQNSGWAEFHTRYLGDLAAVARTALFPKGYIARLEKSVQIRRTEEKRHYPIADMMIIDPDLVRAAPPHGLATAIKEQMQIKTMPLLEALPTKIVTDNYSAIAIRKREDLGGDPVAWIELLSSGNKPGGSDSEHYQKKREVLLASGMVFVEIDYLHESSPTLNKVKDYADFVRDTPKTDALPYRIVVFIPRPSLKEGSAQVKEFHIDTPVPDVEVPLSNDESFTLQCNRAYQMAYTMMLYGNEVDYSKLPVHFERYSLIDKTLIARRMLAIHQAHAAGADLEGDSFLETEAVSLRDALEKMNLV